MLLAFGVVSANAAGAAAAKTPNERAVTPAVATPRRILDVVDIRFLSLMRVVVQ